MKKISNEHILAEIRRIYNEYGYKLIVVDYRHSFTQEYINQCLGLA